MRPRPGSSAATGSSGQRSAPIRATISAAGTTSSSCQPLLVPTSMYSMKRRMCAGAAEPLGHLRRSTSSLTPRLTTMLTLTGRPAAAAASMPSSTRCDREADVVHPLEHLVVERVQADRDRSRPAARSAVRLARQQRAVGGQRQVAQAVARGGRPASRPASRCRGAAAARRRSGGASRRRPRTKTRATRVDLLERQQLGAGEELVAAARTPRAACSRCSGSCSGR